MNAYPRAKQKKNRFLIALLIALLLHTFVFLFLFLKKSAQQKKELPPEAVEELLDLPTQKAGASSFSPDQGQNDAQVLFYEPSEPTLIESPTPSAEPIQEMPSPKPEKVPPQPTFVQEIEPEPAHVPTVKPEEIAPNTPMVKEHNPFVPQFKARAVMQKIGKGFLEHMQDQGNDSINVNGSDRPASLRDIQFTAYIQKMYWNIQNAFKSDRTVINLNYDERTISNIKIIIDKYGEIIDMRVINPPKNRSLDQLIRTLIYRAAPFPPLPKHFERETFSHVLRIEMHLPRGTHQPSWHCY